MEFFTSKSKKTRALKKSRDVKKTRRASDSKVLDVRSEGAVKLFEKAIVKGPLTLVYVNAKWCGACHKFNDEVWSHLTKLKNKSVNLASVDADVFNKTSLSGTPPKFYPTLMLVGKDKKPATFKDEEGKPTNSMPRNSTLAEDKATLTQFIQNPTVKPEFSQKESLRRETVSNTQLSKSPFEPNSTMTSAPPPNIMPNSKLMVKEVPSSNPPDVGADLVSSQSQAKSSGQKQAGGMLQAIRREAAALKAVLKMRNRSTRKNRK
jgi:thiol-disulfide isomerase/thioredoxin